MKVFGYVRVSTNEQATSGDSLETQKNQIVGYAMMKGWQIEDIFVEAGVSGSVPLAERPSGTTLLYNIKSGDAVITAKLDRMFRSARDALETLEALKADGISLHMIDLGGDVTGNGVSKLVFTILSAVAENERERIRDRIREVKRHLASQGIYGGGQRPFGFDIGPNRKLIPNESEQNLLSVMRDARAGGASWRRLGAMAGLEPTTVRRILRREAK
jgi:putative DNA-invertase from lambdoid prophage Rac